MDKVDAPAYAAFKALKAKRRHQAQGGGELEPYMRKRDDRLSGRGTGGLGGEGGAAKGAKVPLWVEARLGEPVEAVRPQRGCSRRPRRAEREALRIRPNASNAILAPVAVKPEHGALQHRRGAKVGRMERRRKEGAVAFGALRCATGRRS